MGLSGWHWCRTSAVRGFRAPLWLLEHDLNVFTAGGVADDDGSRQADLKGFAGAGVPAFLIEREEIGILGRANRRPANAPTVHVRQRDGRRVDNIDIQLWSPLADE